MSHSFRSAVAAIFAVVFAACEPSTPAQSGDLKIQTKWEFAADAVHPDGVLNGAIQFVLPEKFHVQSDKPLDEYLVPTRLTLTVPDGFTVREIVYPKALLTRVPGSDDPQPVFDHTFEIGFSIRAPKDASSGSFPVTATLDYQACDDKTCLAPAALTLKGQLVVVAANAVITPTKSGLVKGIVFSAEPVAPVIPATQSTRTSTPTTTPVADCDVIAVLNQFEVIGTTGGYLSADEFIKFVNDSESGVVKHGIFEGKGPLAIILLIIIGGVLLNLTPCVLPLIPINLAIIGAGAQAGSRARGFALGGTYGLAMAFVYGVLGLVVTLTSTAFGAINSTIWFNVAIAILFVVLALAMFDLIIIDFTKYQSKLDATKVAKSGTFALAFFMGCVSALLAGACVAPVVIQVVVYAGDQYAKGSTIALALPFFLGLGMALPWPFAGAGLSLLPKPGMWMKRVKQAMGVFILIFAGYYAYLAWEIWDNTRVDRTAVQHAVNEQLEGGWTASICDGLVTAQAENKLVLIDMWATWCKNCLAMDKSTFRDSRVEARLKNYVKIKYQAEDLSAAPAKQMLERFEGIGLPTYAILRPKTSNQQPTKPAESGR